MQIRPGIRHYALDSVIMAWHGNRKGGDLTR